MILGKALKEGLILITHDLDFGDLLAASGTGLPNHMARVLDVLEESAQRLQILIITPHPERYRGLRAARFIDLEEIVSAAVTEGGGERERPFRADSFCEEMYNAFGLKEPIK